MDLDKQIAEVIETSNSEFLAQCYVLDGMPAFGSLVKTRSSDCQIYALVCASGTHSIEQGRRIVARGQGAASPAEVFKAHPQLAKLLCSDFKALVVGHDRGGVMRQYLPPSPAGIYAFVYACKPEEVRSFTGSLDFLDLLIDSRLPAATDEVIAAFLRFASLTHEAPQEFLVKAGKGLAWLLSNDVRRLDSLLKRLRI